MERSAHRLITLSSIILAGAIGLTGCSPAEDDSDGCSGKCDGLGDGVGEALAGRSDPVAKFLRENGIDDKGFIDIDWGQLLVGVAETQGCSPESLKTFIVSDDLITGSETFPRLVATACADDSAKASEFFIAASFESAEEEGEMDFLSIETFAWDPQKRRYQFYESFPADRGGVRFDVSPTKCEGCHLTPSDMAPTAMHMTPIMNELFRPWTHWNASPGFPSFDFNVPDRATGSDSWSDWVLPWQGQADQLELLIKAGHDKVALARLRERRDSVDIDKAMGLLRPVFCAEQVNYVSEDFGSGQLLGTTVLDPGLSQAFFQVRPDNWPWAWVNDQSLRLPSSGGEVIKQMPVRGNSDLTVEKLLMSTKVLTAEQVLQVRALDYKNPVFSEFRCGLWKEAKSRFEGTPPDLTGATRISHAIPILFDGIMVLGDRPISADGKIVAVPEANADATGNLFLALGDGSLTSDCTAGACAVTLDELGAQIQVYYDTFAKAAAPRADLFAARDARICKIVEKVKAADARFDDDDTQRQCGEICCENAGMAGDEICIGQAAAAAKAFDNSQPHFECAVQCASPSRFPNRPSLPAVSECETSSVFLP